MLRRINILASRSFTAWLLFSEADPGAAPPLGNAGSEEGASPGAGPVGRCVLRMCTRVGELNPKRSKLGSVLVLGIGWAEGGLTCRCTLYCVCRMAYCPVTGHRGLCSCRKPCLRESKTCISLHGVKLQWRQAYGLNIS